MSSNICRLTAFIDTAARGTGAAQYLTKTQKSLRLSLQIFIPQRRPDATPFCILFVFFNVNFTKKYMTLLRLDSYFFFAQLKLTPQSLSIVGKKRSGALRVEPSLIVKLRCRGVSVPHGLLHILEAGSVLKGPRYKRCSH